MVYDRIKKVDKDAIRLINVMSQKFNQLQHGPFFGSIIFLFFPNEEQISGLCFFGINWTNLGHISGSRVTRRTRGW